MTNSTNTGPKGFTLIELMIGMAIASVLMAGIYSFFQSQLKNHITQQELVDMQQDARAGMSMMISEIRMAGLDPQNTGQFTILSAQEDIIFFRSDIDGNGSVAINEHFYYALSNGNLVRGGNFDEDSNMFDLSPVALNIDALNFVYLDGAGNVLDDDGNGNVTSNQAAIRSVEVTLVARSGEQIRGLMYRQKDSRTYTNKQGLVLLDDPDDDFHRMQLTAAVKIRNLGL
jgi:type IV pilus assembly protein PilW